MRYYNTQARRKSGEPFVYHPLEVAKILATNNLSITTVAAGLLHDTFEDCNVSEEDLQKEFGGYGTELAFLVSGVTKVTGAATLSEKRHSDLATYQKLIIAAARDARVLVIKLADRLHNLRTISYLKADRKMAIGLETLNIYAPLAHRIGMTAIKTELEDRSLAITDPTSYEEANLIIKEALTSGDSALKAIAEDIKSSLSEDNIEYVSVKSRVKSRLSIVEKLRRYSNQEYLLEDVLGIRIIVDSIDDCYRTLGKVHNLYPPKSDSFDDYIAAPRANLYQSLHTAVLVPFRESKKIIEIQIRTQDMDDIAERGIAAHWNYKAKFNGKTSLKRKGKEPDLDSLDTRPIENDDIEEAFENLREDLFAEESYCFTPNGDIKILPANSNAIDFAYSLHSDLGDQIVGSRANGALYPITKPLENNSIVEIMTSRKGTPSMSWLKTVQTNRAKQRIRAYHSTEPNREHQKQLIHNLRVALRQAGILKEASNSGEYFIEKIKIFRPGISDSDIFEKLEDDKFILEIVDRFLELEKEKEAAAESLPAIPKVKRAPSSSDRIVIINGEPGIKYRLANCCEPKDTDTIIGYISSNPEAGVIIHRKDCKNILRIKNSDSSNKLLSAMFGTAEDIILNLQVDLKFKDRPELLSDLAEAVYSSGAEIINIDMSSSLGIVRGHLLCRVAGQAPADNLLEEIQGIDGLLEWKETQRTTKN